MNLALLITSELDLLTLLDLNFNFTLLLNFNPSLMFCCVLEIIWEI